MDFDEFRRMADRTGISTFAGKQKEFVLMYLGLGIAGEAGEIAEKIKKIIRNDDGVVSEEKKEALKQEIGDVLWYLSQLARHLEMPFSEPARANVDKLTDRIQRGVIKSEGDNR